MSSFIDEVTLLAKAGDGGHGCVAWRREAHVPRGGPAGGDGGDGGDVVLVADEGVHSLLDFKYEPRLVAKNGEPGRGKNQAGHGGGPAIAKVPIGTEVFDEATGERLADLTRHGEHVVVCRGGSGGFGNARFATPSRQAPDFRKPGLPGEERRLRLSLKLMADVGLLGFPNAGKSTFLAAVSAARPKIGNYPFTTLVPQLGVVAVEPGVSFVLADVPGIIEGASAGAGLGLRFLKHLERVRVLLHLLEVPLEHLDEPADGAPVTDETSETAEVLVARYEVLRTELARFGEALAQLPEIVAVNKVDLLGATGDGEAATGHPAVARLRQHLEARGTPLFFVSGVTGEGIKPLLYALATRVNAARQAAPDQRAAIAAKPATTASIPTMGPRRSRAEAATGVNPFARAPVFSKTPEQAS